MKKIPDLPFHFFALFANFARNNPYSFLSFSLCVSARNIFTPAGGRQLQNGAFLRLVVRISHP
jgi:hypothetical protein